MRVYKFGGASVKDAAGIKNLNHILTQEPQTKLVVVVSAMGKTTNALEAVVQAYFNNTSQINVALHVVKQYHQEIIEALFPEKSAPIYSRVSQLFNELNDFLERNKSPDYNFVYDQVVSYGELLSTIIISQYLHKQNLTHQWLDSRDVIKTDTAYREGNVDWASSQKNLIKTISKNNITLTQGFIASDSNGFTTTLGREGSDYTAAIIAYCLSGESVTIWKDVPGVLSADPRYFKNAQLLHKISYQEAIELAFYGASVIHPKTLQPLQRKEIPLFVKSFTNPKAPGTRVGKGASLQPITPCFILKKDQVLLALSSLDFSFMIEENIGEVFKLLGKNKMKVDLIQNSAISFSVCIDNKYNNLEELVAQLSANFKVEVHTQVDLYTIRHFDEAAIKQLEQDKHILLKQVAQQTVQLVVAQS